MTTPVWTNRFSLAPPAFIPLAQGLSLGVAGPSGANMWATKIERIASPGTVVYGASNGAMFDTFSGLLPLDTIELGINGQPLHKDANGLAIPTRLNPGQANAIYAACQAKIPPVPVTLAQITAMLASILVFDAEPFSTLSYLGLRFQPGAL